MWRWEPFIAGAFKRIIAIHVKQELQIRDKRWPRMGRYLPVCHAVDTALIKSPVLFTAINNNNNNNKKNVCECKGLWDTFVWSAPLALATLAGDFWCFNYPDSWPEHLPGTLYILNMGAHQTPHNARPSAPPHLPAVADLWSGYNMP